MLGAGGLTPPSQTAPTIPSDRPQGAQHDPDFQAQIDALIVSINETEAAGFGMPAPVRRIFAQVLRATHIAAMERAAEISIAHGHQGSAGLCHAIAATIRAEAAQAEAAEAPPHEDARLIRALYLTLPGAPWPSTDERGLMWGEVEGTPEWHFCATLVATMRAVAGSI